MDVINISCPYHGKTQVRVVRETAKAILVEGAASQAWFPKAAIDGDGEIASWFSLGIEHFFLFDAPFNGAA